MRQMTPGGVDSIASTVGFGTSGLMRVAGRRRREAILACAFAAGITHFDTAPIYGLGESERALGRFLRGRRDQVSITTKFGLSVGSAAARLAPLQRIGRLVYRALPAIRSALVRTSRPVYARPDFRAPAVQASLERSLRSLCTDYVDYFLAHECSLADAPGPELVELLEHLRCAGKIRSYGIASTFERAYPLASSHPELASVVQFESDVFAPNTERLPAQFAALLITHGALSRALPRLKALSRDRPELTSRWSQEIGADLSDQLTAGALLLRAAALSNPRGIVLMQSTSPEHIEQNASAVTSASRDTAVQRLRGLLGGTPYSDC